MFNTSSSIANGLEQQFAHVETIKAQLPEFTKIQLHSGMEGFESPDAFGVYRKTGGKPVGVVGSVFEPCDLNLFLDSLVQSTLECNCDLQLDKIKYTEYKDGAKVAFIVPYKSFEVKAKRMVGDITNVDLMFSTGFDGLTKKLLGFRTFRRWCSNGAKRIDKDNSVTLSFKNTANNHAKTLTWVNEIVTILGQVDAHAEQLNRMASIEVNSKQVNDYISKVTGYSLDDYKDLNTRKRNILDAINASVAVEVGNTGANVYSILQGITRYTTHNLAGGDIEGVMFDNAAKLNEAAHVAAMELILN